MSKTTNTNHEVSTKEIIPYDRSWKIFSLPGRNNQDRNFSIGSESFFCRASYLFRPTETRSAVWGVFLFLHVNNSLTAGCVTVIAISEIGVGLTLEEALAECHFESMQVHVSSKMRFQAKRSQFFSANNPFILDNDVTIFIDAILRITKCDSKFFNFIKEIYKMLHAASIDLNILQKLLPAWHHVNPALFPEAAESDLDHIEKGLIPTTKSVYANSARLAYYIPYYDIYFPGEIPALHLAILKNEYDYVATAVMHNPRLCYTRCPFGLFPISLAIDLGHFEIAEILLFYHNPRDSIYIEKFQKTKWHHFIANIRSHQATLLHNPEQEQQHLVIKQFFNTVYGNNYPLPQRPELHRLIIAGDITTALKLINDNININEALINQQDPWGHTPLSLAVENAYRNPIQYEELIALLLKSGAKLENDVSYPFQYSEAFPVSASHCIQRIKVKYSTLPRATTPGVAKLLLFYGADIRDLWPCIFRTLQQGDASFIEMAALYGSHPHHAKSADADTGETLLTVTLSRTENDRFLHALKVLLICMRDSYLPEGLFSPHIPTASRQLIQLHNRQLAKPTLPLSVIKQPEYFNILQFTPDFTGLTMRRLVYRREKETGKTTPVIATSTTTLTSDLSLTEREELNEFIFDIFEATPPITQEQYFNNAVPTDGKKLTFIECHRVGSALIGFSLFSFVEQKIENKKPCHTFIYGLGMTRPEYEGNKLLLWGMRIFIGLVKNTSYELSLYTDILYPGLSFNIIDPYSTNFYPKNFPHHEARVAQLVAFTGEQRLNYQTAHSSIRLRKVLERTKQASHNPWLRVLRDCFGNIRSSDSTTTLFPPTAEFIASINNALNAIGFSDETLQHTALMWRLFMGVLQMREERPYSNRIDSTSTVTSSAVSISKSPTSSSPTSSSSYINAVFFPPVNQKVSAAVLAFLREPTAKM